MVFAVLCTIPMGLVLVGSIIRRTESSPLRWLQIDYRLMVRQSVSHSHSPERVGLDLDRMFRRGRLAVWSRRRLSIVG